ncbi:MAG: inositol monophosphatase family protein [bacterium]|nr:inositol monophosphatase family protein [bacterium]MCP5067671.1 inositol monophosphatase family protein [bacterium]
MPEPVDPDTGDRGLGSEEIRSHLEAAVVAVETAGPIALRYFRSGVEVANKAGGAQFDPVTSADREVEASIRSDLGRLFPGYGVLGEEQGVVESDSSLRWVIDPIDGTRAFISGVPLWGILLGLTRGSECLAGVMHQPYTGETFLGTREDAWLRRSGKEQALRTSTTSGLSSAILYCTHPSMFVRESDRSGFGRVAAASRMMRYGGDCYSYALLAMGQIDLVIEGSLEPYDIIPLIPIVEGAGGVVTDGQGGSALGGGIVVAAANPELHARALETFNT